MRYRTDSKHFEPLYQVELLPTPLFKLTLNGQATDNGSSDNCTLKSVTVSPRTFSCANLGANQVTLTVTDTSNNGRTALATVTVTGTVPHHRRFAFPHPVPGLRTANGHAHSQRRRGATYQWPPATGLSNSTSAITTFTASAGGCTAMATVTFTVDDVQCGTKTHKV